jgi:hypothetical protein
LTLAFGHAAIPATSGRTYTGDQIRQIERENMMLLSRLDQVCVCVCVFVLVETVSVLLSLSLSVHASPCLTEGAS